MTHAWTVTAAWDKSCCVDCGTVVWRRFQDTTFAHALYRIPGETSWRRERPDCAAVAADKMRSDQERAA